jgi:hypothetical protein
MTRHRFPSSAPISLLAVLVSLDITGPIEIVVIANKTTANGKLLTLLRDFDFLNIVYCFRSDVSIVRETLEQVKPMNSQKK